MKIAEVMGPLNEGPVSRISKQQAIDRSMFGPVYHGTSQENRAAIAAQGFKAHGTDDVNASNGFGGNFDAGYPGIPPVHLLGYGIYFTASPSVAKQYNQNSMRGVIEYYLDVPRLEEIGFTSTNTIWRWWVQNGYDFSPELMARRNEAGRRGEINTLLQREQGRATKHMTEVLAGKFDAVHLRRSAYRRGVDDTQICVYDPRRIYQIDKSLSAGWDVGSVVTHNQRIHYSPEYMQQYDLRAEKQSNDWTYVTRPAMDNNPNGSRITRLMIPPPGMKGTVVQKRPITSVHMEFLRKSLDPRIMNQLGSNMSVKWQKGGIQHGYYEAELDPLTVRE